MRGVLTLLTLIALMAVMTVGYLVMKKNGTLPIALTQHTYQRVLPSQTDPDGDRLAQIPMTPPVVTPVPVTPQAIPDTVQSRQPRTNQPYSVDTIDASAPPMAPPAAGEQTPEAYKKLPETPAPTVSAEGEQPAAKPAPEKSAAEPNSEKAPSTKPTQSKVDHSLTFDKNNIFTLQRDMHKNGYHDQFPVVVVVDKGAHFTYVLQNQKGRVVIVNRFSNAVGAADTPSPPGPYKVASIQRYPVWTPPKSIDPEQKQVKPFNVDSHNPLGVEIIRLNKFQVALHGTNAPHTLRTDASHGCVRHSNDDILKLARMVRKGTTVIITDQFVGTKISKAMFGSR